MSPSVAARRRLERLKYFMASFVEASVGLTLTDLDGRFIEVNRVFCEITGYSVEELRTRNFQSITFPDDLPQNLELRSQILVGERDNFVMEKRYIKKSGGIVWVKDSTSVTGDADPRARAGAERPPAGTENLA